MVNNICQLFILITFLVSCKGPIIQTGQIAIFPKPNRLDVGGAYFTFTSKTKILVENEDQLNTAKLALLPYPSFTPMIEVGTSDQPNRIISRANSQLKEEAYRLRITSDGVVIEASSSSGFYYGWQSLFQCMPTSFYHPEPGLSSWQIPVLDIQDRPAFTWRGFMLDVSRHFFTVDQVKEVIDIIASLKFNKFHWHLTDDQGWRIEIKSYPKLTEIGAWRMDYNNRDESISDWWGRPVQQEGDDPKYGGFYTQKEIKEIVAYARDRHIDIIPEIDMPGHAQALVASYPELGCVNAAPYVATGGVFQNNTVNPGKEATFVFAEKMLNEVMDLFPSGFVHIGGDECNKNQWKIDPDAQRRMMEEGLANEEELQSYFIKRIEKIINARDYTMIGWDEILEGGLAPNAVVMSWRGEKGGITSVKAGHEVIMTPNAYCYLDLKQGHDDLEPNLGYSQLLLSTAYNYQVLPENLSDEELHLIKGIQGNLWTESISDWGKLTYMTFPRIFAIAENAWTFEENQSWDEFTGRLLIQFERLKAQGIRYAESAFSPWIHHRGNGQNIEIKLTSEVNHVDIHYTVDGTTPTINSPKYADVIILDTTTLFKAQSFNNNQPIGYTSEQFFPIHLAKNQTIGSTDGSNIPALSDLSYARLHPSDSNWVKFGRDAELLITFDSVIVASEVRFNSLRFTISGYYPPYKIELFGRKDGKNYSLLTDEDPVAGSLIQGRNKLNHQLTFSPTPIDQLKIKLYNHHSLPEGQHRAGESSRFTIDEIVVF